MSEEAGGAVPMEAGSNAERASDPAPRWLDYVLAHGAESESVLLAAAKCGDRLVLVMGDGFDPRDLHAIRQLLRLGLRPHVVQIGLPRGRGRGPSSLLAERNRQDLSDLVQAHGLVVDTVPYPSGIERLSVGSMLSRSLVADSIIRADDVVVLDINALPTRLYFPLLGTLMELNERDGCGELLVVVSENPALDELIISEGTEDPGAVVGFTHGLTAEYEPDRIRVWAPVLGEDEGPQLESIYELLQPHEVYPVLPFPARNPRRGDDIILEHRVLLFDRFEASPKNFLYVDEANPFDTYRALVGLNDRYVQTLAPLGKPQIVTSAHSSKTLSIGVCLAAWESKLPVVTAGPSQYRFDEMPDLDWVESTSRIACMWVRGTPFR